MAVFKEWPTTVPHQPVAGTMEIVEVDDAARSDFDPPGEPEVRNRSTHSLTNVSFVIIPMTDAQNEARKNFVRNDLRRGVRWFRMRLYQSGYVGYECQLAKPMQSSDHDELEGDKTRDGGVVYWNVGIELIVRDFDIPRSGGQIWLVETYGDQQVYDWMLSIKEVVNVGYPSVFGV